MRLAIAKLDELAVNLETNSAEEKREMLERSAATR